MNKGTISDLAGSEKSGRMFISNGEFLRRLNSLLFWRTVYGTWRLSD